MKTTIQNAQQSQKFVRLADVCSLVTERVPAGSASRLRVDLEHIDPGTGLLTDDAVPATPEGARIGFQRNDILFGKLRPYLRKTHLASEYGECSTEIWVIRARTNIVNPRYLHCVLRSQAVQRLANATSGTKMPRADWEHVAEAPVWIPASTVQDQIAHADIALERFGRLLTQAIAAKREQKRGLMQQLLTGKVRFPGFTEPWKTVRLGDVAHEVSERNKGQLAERDVCGVIKGAGLMPMRERVMGDDLTRYLVVDPHSFAYNPMRLNIGSIAFNTSHRRVLVSPDYVVFSTQSASLRPEYLNHLRASWLWERFVQRAGSGSVRTRIYFDDLAQLRLPLPAPTEQDRINALLQDHNAEIRLLAQQRDTLATQRRGLMERLLSGDIAIPSSDTSAA